MNAVIFDMDGLMFDTERVFIDAFDYAGQQMGIGKAGYMAIKTLGLSGQMSRDVWLEEFGDKYDEDALRLHRKAFLSKYYKENHVPIKKGGYELLQDGKDNKEKGAVASSAAKWEVDSHFSDAGVKSFFQVVVSGDMVKFPKPNPQIYEMTCELLNETPNNCIALEDSKYGVLSAYRAGCKTIMIPDLWQPDEETKSILYARFNNLFEVIAFLQNTAV